MTSRPLAPQPVRSLLALLVGILLSPALAEARPITNIDTDGDGIPNYKDNNIDGPGETVVGLTRDSLLNWQDTDMDGDGLANDAATEIDIDADGCNDDDPEDKDIDGDFNKNNAKAEKDIDGDFKLDDAIAETDIDGDGGPADGAEGWSWPARACSPC